MNGNQWVAVILAAVCLIALYTRVGANQAGSREEHQAVTETDPNPIRVIGAELVSSFDAPQRARLAGAFAGIAQALTTDGNAAKPWVTHDYQAEQLVVRSLPALIAEGEVPDAKLAPLAAAIQPKLKECIGSDATLSTDERAQLVELLRGLSRQFGGA